MFNVWKNVLAEIEQQIPHMAFMTWFNNVSLDLTDDNTATIIVPDVFKVKQIKKYNSIIETALKNNGVKFEKIDYKVHSKSEIKIKSREMTYEEDLKKVAKRVKKPLNNFTTGLKSDYTMDNFVIGSNNDLAVSVAKNVIENPGVKYNPFFLYGGPGLGKTHLVQAIGNELLKRNPKLKILYTPINHFYSDFVNSIKKGKGDEFNTKFRKLDVLIIDDFQFIVGKEKSQEEFFNIFNDLYQLNKQIIITSDRLPSQIKTIDERLASRLTWAGAIDLQLPSFEDKCAILKSKAEYMGIDIEDKAIEFIAESVKTNIRDLESKFSHLIAVADLKNMSPLEVIEDGYVTTTYNNTNTVTSKQIIEKVAKNFGLTVSELKSKSRVTNIKDARQISMYLLSEELNLSTPKIANEVGVKDHTTVMHGINRIKDNLKTNFKLREQISIIREKLYE